MTSENPMIAFSGVRSSWLIFAKNSDLVRLAASAPTLARCSFSASMALSRKTRRALARKVAGSNKPHRIGESGDRLHHAFEDIPGRQQSYAGKQHREQNRDIE